MTAVSAPRGWPTHLIIRGEKWSVTYHTDLRDGDTELLGRMVSHRRELQLDVDQTQDSMVHILLHEIHHAYTVTSPPGAITEEMHEVLCDHFGSSVKDLVRNNGLEWIRGRG